MNSRKILLSSAVAAALFVAAPVGAGGLVGGVGGGVGGSLSGTAGGLGGLGGWGHSGMIDGAMDAGVSHSATAAIETSRRAGRVDNASGVESSTSAVARGTASATREAPVTESKILSRAKSDVASQQNSGSHAGTGLSSAVEGTSSGMASVNRNPVPDAPHTQPQQPNRLGGAIQNSTAASGSASARSPQPSQTDSGLAVSGSGSTTSSATVNDTNSP